MDSTDGGRRVINFAEHTIWVRPALNGLFEAVDYQGNVIAVHRHKSTLRYIIQQDITIKGWNIWAIADVIPPHRRQPNRRLPRRKRR